MINADTLVRSGPASTLYFLVYYHILYYIFVTIRLISLYTTGHKVVSFPLVFKSIIKPCTRLLRREKCAAFPIVPVVTDGTSKHEGTYIIQQDAEQMMGFQFPPISREWKIDLRHLDLGFVVAKGGFSKVYKGRYFHCPVAIKDLYLNEVYHYIVDNNLQNLISH